MRTHVDRWKRAWLAGALSGALVVAGVTVFGPLAVQGADTPDKLVLQGQGEPLALDRQASLLEGFNKVAKTVEPAVVNISTTAVVRGAQGQEELLERFFGPMTPRERAVRSLGSGVIVDSKGYILTNYHVIAEADKVEVKLASGDTYVARVIGEDPETDLAVLKIDTPKLLPFAKIGDSSRLNVGDWVLAIGSPFGFEQTVTSGIVSANHRVVDPRAGTNPFGDYIQTDASINPGNSGGPLVNMKGEVVGINSWIAARSGQSAGVGFAIPSSVFVNSYNQLVTKGQVERGWLGISMNEQPMTPEMARHFGVDGQDAGGLKDGDGVVVTQLIDETGAPSESGPAFRAGIRAEDVIVRIGAREVENSFDVRSVIGNTAPGEVVPVTVVRKGQVLSFDVTLAERTLNRRAEEKSLSFEERRQERPKEIGLSFHTATPQESRQLGLEDGQAVIIDSVAPASKADEAGLQPQQVITHVNGQAVTSAQAFKRRIESIASGEGVVLRVVVPGPQQGIFYTSFVKS